MQRVSGMMDKQSQSLTGLFSTLKDTVSQQLGAAMQPAVEEIKKQLPGITDAIGGALTALGPVIGPVIGSLGQAFQALLPAITPVLDVVSQLLATGLGALAQIVADVVAPALTNLQPVFAALTEAFGILANALGPAIKPILDGLVTAFNALAPALPPLAVLIGKLAAAIGAGLGRVLEKIAPQIPLIAEQLVVLAEEAVPPLVDAVVALAPVLAIIAEILATSLLGAMIAVVPVVRVLAGAIRGLALLLEAVFTAKWNDIFDGAADKVNEWIDGVLSFFGSLPSKLAAIAGNIWKPIANAFIEMLNMIIGAWNSLDFKLPSFAGLNIAGKQVLPGWGGPTLGVPDIPEIPKFHAGGVSATEGLALLRRDETVFTPDQMRVLGQAIAGGGGATPIAVTSAPVLRIEGNVYAGDLEERLNRILKQHDRDLLDELTARGFVSRR
jgi:phage-related protein